jgi:putative DNA primase/helicase
MNIQLTPTISVKTVDATRKLSIAIYASEREVVPRTVDSISPEDLKCILSKRKLKPGKSGFGFSQCSLKEGGTRRAADIASRSGIEGDIDGGATLDDLRTAIEPYWWDAYSTHSHDPENGKFKFRLVMPFCRDVSPSEWQQVWCGFNVLLDGALDPNTKDISRLVYLPSCPEEKKAQAFYEHHDGALIDPDKLIKLAQQITISGVPATEKDNVTNRLLAQPPVEVPSEIERVKSMLAIIPADCDRSTWLRVLWSVAATQWECAEDLARSWSMTAPEKYDDATFNRAWNSFDPDGGVGFGTLDYHARLHGWYATSSEVEKFTGSGGDVRNGRLFANEWLDKLMFIHETGEVLTFKETSGWVDAPPGEADRAAKDVLAKLREYAAECYKTSPEDPKTKRIMAHVERTSKAPNLFAMIQMARSEPGMTRSLNEFDANQMHLGLENGVLNLKTVSLLPVSPDLLVSKRCPVAYDPVATCPKFINFLDVVQPEPEMRDFLHRLVGYILTGGVDEQKFAFLFGSGANGKSVFVELLAWLLGDYARKIATEMLMHHQRSPQGPSPDIVALKGRRFVYANETEEGRRLAESRVKDMTGGDTLTGRVPYSKADITFQPTHKLIVVGNHRPEITDMSNGMWRRVLLVPFDVTIPESQRDPKLLEKLKAEGSGILNWALEGLRHWQKDGLKVPKKIEGATASYRDEMDIIGEWIAEHCDTGAGCTVNKTDAYKAYHKWTLENGHHPLAKGRLTRRLSDRGYKQLPDKRTIGGLALNKVGETAMRRLF